MTRTLGVQRKSVKQPLSRERVLSAAIDLADQEGIEGLSMRRLAQALEVEAMSLYHWFPNKDALLAAMIDTVFAEMERPALGGDWRPALRAAAIHAYRTLLGHPWAAKLIGRAFEPGLGQVGWMDAILGRLRSGGLSPELTHHAYHAIDSHIVGFTLWVLPYIELTRERPDFAEQVISKLPMADLPHFAEHVDYHLAEEEGGPSEFDFGLDLLLDGLERQRLSG
ncbi:MAG TPA: TetR/AcrR family transcriptional regulator C-terminal domain-containing protein [Candidatus Limnocylindria bacterium]|nr:TetR/AcrR family transcriptional regulator C-terminal domain-containing protein [Candidatus Limnocylindria bacterium]